jgi:hypothetical protein
MSDEDMSDTIESKQNIVTLVPSKTDAETAADLKQRAIIAYQPILDLCTEATNAGFEIQIASGPTPTGHVITVLKVVKIY